jgi:hypothetical protein
MRRVAIAAVFLFAGAADTAIGHELFGMHLHPAHSSRNSCRWNASA